MKISKRCFRQSWLVLACGWLLTLAAGPSLAASHANKAAKPDSSVVGSVSTPVARIVEYAETDIVPVRTKIVAVQLKVEIWAKG